MERRRPVLAGVTLALLALSTGGCRTTEEKHPAAPANPVVHRAAPRSAWRVELDGETIGHVVHFASEESPESAVYVVRNSYGQDLGWVDSLGRAYRLLPHHRDPAWVGTGSVAQGVARILRAPGPCMLVEESLDELSQGAGPEPESGP